MDPEEPRRDSLPVRARKRAGAVVRSKWGRRILGTLLAGVLLLVGSAVFISQTEWGEERIRQLTVDALESELGLDATLEDFEVEWGWLPPSPLSPLTC